MVPRGWRRPTVLDPHPDQSRSGWAGQAAARAVRDPGLGDGTVVDFPERSYPDRTSSACADTARPPRRRRSPPSRSMVLQGGRDFQVGRADYDGWAKALGGHLDATLKLYPTLNHLLRGWQRAAGPGGMRRPDQHVAEEVVADIAKCIAQSPARTSSTRLPPCEGRASYRPLRPTAGRALRSGPPW